jgi:hypothetical protein
MKRDIIAILCEYSGKNILQKLSRYYNIDNRNEAINAECDELIYIVYNRRYSHYNDEDVYNKCWTYTVYHLLKGIKIYDRFVDRIWYEYYYKLYNVEYSYNDSNLTIIYTRDDMRINIMIDANIEPYLVKISVSDGEYDGELSDDIKPIFTQIVNKIKKMI